MTFVCVKMAGRVNLFQGSKNDKNGVPILSRDVESLPDKQEYVYHIAIGNNTVRKKYHEDLLRLGLQEVNIIDKSAIIASDCKLGQGNYVGRFAVIDADVIIGDCNIINTGAIIEHGARLGDCNNVSTGVILNGDVEFGNESFAGSSCVVNGQIRSGDNVIIGSGAVVTKDVQDGLVVVGIPAKPRG